GQRLQPAPRLPLPGGVQLLRHLVRLDADGGSAFASRRLCHSPVPADREAGPLPVNILEKTAAWLLAILWLLPLLYAMWAAFHPPASATHLAARAPRT